MSSRRKDHDEGYVIDICNRVLGLAALRQHRFVFLVGDPNKRGRCARLPVDAYYPDLNLVIEYHEIQHYQATYMDNKMTCSGMLRGEQRKLYDERRKTDLPKHNIQVIVLEYHLFEHLRGRLKRMASDDELIVRSLLAAYIGKSCATKT